MKLSIEQPLLDSRVGADAPVAHKLPVRPIFIHAVPIDFADHHFLLIDRTFGENLAVRPANETLPPEFNSVAAGRRFMADAIRCGDVAAVRNRVAPLNGFPGGMLGPAKFFFLARMPPDRRRIKIISEQRSAVSSADS